MGGGLSRCPIHPALWNSLCENIYQSDPLTRFKAVLKTRLFKLTYLHYGTVVYNTLMIMYFIIFI